MSEVTQQEQKPVTHQDRKPTAGSRTADSGARSGGDLLVVDSSYQNWKVQFLRGWAQIKGTMTSGASTSICGSEWDTNRKHAMAAGLQSLPQFRNSSGAAVRLNGGAVWI